MQFWRRFHLRRRIDKCCRRLDKDFNINSGGCCFVAYLIAKNLEKLHIPFKLVVESDLDCYDDSNGFENIKERKLNSFPTGNSVQYHYFIKIDTGTINKDDDCSDHSFVTYSGITSEDIKWIYDTGSWNDDYNYDDNDTVEQLINKSFKIYEKDI